MVIEKLKALEVLRQVELDGAAANSCYVNLTKNENEETSDIIGGALTEFNK